MADHYEVLGVPRDASAADVKRAYRVAASAAHPDKGGDPERMTLVNTANDVLSDPDRRARYDETGLDTMPKLIDVEARSNALQALAKVLDQDGNIIHLATIVLMCELSKCQVGLAAATLRLSKLKRCRESVTSRAESNLVHMLVDQNIAAVEASMKIMQRGMEVLPLAVEMLGKHEFADKPQTMPLWSELA